MEKQFMVVKFNKNEIKPEELCSWCKLYAKNTGIKVIPVPNELDIVLYSTDEMVKYLEITLEQIKECI